MILDARQLMTPAPPCLDEAESVVLAARRMRALGVSSVPVSGSGNDFIGMLSERDIVERCVADGQDPRLISVGSLVQNCQQTISVDQPADSAVLGLVLRQPFGLLPVVDNGVLVGVITLAGITSQLIDDKELDASAPRLWWPT